MLPKSLERVVKKLISFDKKNDANASFFKKQEKTSSLAINKEGYKKLKISFYNFITYY